MHVEILVECSFTSGGLLGIIHRCCGVAHEQVEVSGLICRFGGIDRVARERVGVSGFICRFGGVGRVAREQVGVSEVVCEF